MKKMSVGVLSRDVKLIKAASKITHIAKILSVIPAVAVGAVLVFDAVRLIKSK